MGFIDGIKRVFVGEEEEDEEMTPIYDNDDDADVVSRLLPLSGSQ